LFRYQDWDLIAKQLGTGRSGYQCFAQYQSCPVVEVSKQRWTEAEDEQLKAMVEKFRIGDFIPWGQVMSLIVINITLLLESTFILLTCFTLQVAINMRGRSKIQVYNRWTYSLDPKIKKGRFTIQEDIIILRGVQK